MGCDRARIEARGHGHRVRHRHARRRVGAGVPRPAARPDTGRALQDRAQRGHGIPSGHRPVGRGIPIGLHALHAPQDRALCRGRARRFHQRAHAGPRPRHRRSTGRRRRNRRRAVDAQPSRERAAGRAHRAPALAREGGRRAGRRYRRAARGERAPVCRCRGLGGDRDGPGPMLLRRRREGGRAHEDRPAPRGREARARTQGGAVRGTVERKAVPRGWPNASSRSRAT